MNARHALLVAATAAVALLHTACDNPRNTFVPPPPPKVTVAHPTQKDVVRYLTYSATTEAQEDVELRARVPGFLERVAFTPGGRVKRGDLLFVIDKRSYQTAVGRAEARLASAQAAAHSAEQDAKIAEDLASQRAGSEIDRIVKTAQAESARAAVSVAEAELTATRLDLEFCEIRSPIDGRITKAYVDVGNLVGQGAPTLLARVVTTKPIEVTVNFDESDLLELRRARMAQDPALEPGQLAGGRWRPAELALPDNQQFTVHGHVESVDPVLDAQSGTIKAHCLFDNEDELMLPGLFVRVRFPVSTSSAVVVPDIALLTDQAGRYALVVDERDEVAVRRVEIGELDGRMRVVRAGLSTADRIVVNGLQRARPGARVQPVMQSN